MLPLALGGLAVVAVAVVAIVLSQSGGPTSGGSAGSGSIAPLSQAGEALPLYQAGRDDAARGRPIPEVSGTSFDGSPVAIERDGTPKLLLFLAHWCPHCQEEVPKVQAWIAANGLPEGVDFVSVATAIDSRRPNFPPDAWLEREGWTPPVLIDPDDQVADRFGLSAFPYWVAVNGDGTVAERRTGAIAAAELDAWIATLAATAASPRLSAAPTPS